MPSYKPISFENAITPLVHTVRTKKIYKNNQIALTPNYTNPIQLPIGDNCEAALTGGGNVGPPGGGAGLPSGSASAASVRAAVPGGCSQAEVQGSQATTR